MRALRTALAAAGLGATILGTGAPAALALGEERAARPKAASFGFSVSPAAVRPGGAVDLTVTNCTRHEATAESAVFDRVVLGMPGELQSARTTVDTDARVGAEYDVTFTCGAQSGTATLTILAATPSPSPTGTSTASPTASSTVLPTRGAQAGVGGTQSDNDTMLLAGAGLTAAAVTGAVLLARRRTGRHR
ncbi:hypothetical protein [Streptomyces sp. MP131-18]|uniref:hypothetical protein n=1 Tax=Streptomyces sp. MP131-18 TaxID=1857892 RepID=UPI00097C3DCA|nr:hypothetical protein [Streptomyces sp. MP131-18]ONK16203.1 hypothetical protein STBA_70530 [Streptomyces sp. MP131-18]